MANCNESNFGARETRDPGEPDVAVDQLLAELGSFEPPSFSWVDIFDTPEDRAWEAREIEYTKIGAYAKKVAQENPDLGILFQSVAEDGQTTTGMMSSNGKTGRFPYESISWSIPMEKSCLREFPDNICIASDFCRECCYGKDWKQNKPETVQRFAKNELIRQRPDFARIVIGWFKDFEWKRVFAPNGTPAIVRVHAVGDFDNERYIRDWIEIAEFMSSRYIFFTYTRAWRRPELRAALRELAAVENFKLLLSFDKSSGAPPHWKNARTALLLDLDDYGPRPREDTLVVFRARYFHVLQYGRGKRTQLPVMKSLDGSRVCPHEQRIKYDLVTGKTLAPGVTCYDCRMCCPSPWT